MKSFRISIRFNPEYDQNIIDRIESLKSNRNLSKILRQIIRDGINSIEAKEISSLSDEMNNALSNTTNNNKQKQTKQQSQTSSKKENIIKWNWPEKINNLTN